VLSLVTVLQFAEDLTDRQAAAMAVRAIDWKYALGAELTDTGFDASVLSKFRTRLADHGLERVVFDRLVEHCRQAGLVGAGGKQRTDSTHVLSAVRSLNRLELAGESVRAAVEALAVAAPGWLAGHIDVAEFAHRYGPCVGGWTMPSLKTKRTGSRSCSPRTGTRGCRAAWAAGTPAWIREIEAVRLLRQVLVQTYYLHTDSRGREAICKREADDEGVPPGQLRLASPYDPDARWAAKGEEVFWMGYKVHLTETCHTPAEAGEKTVPAPNLITDVATTEATVPDVKATAAIQQRLAARGLKAAEHYLDSGYPSCDLITAAQGQGITMVTPVLLDHSAQARAAEGFDKSAFAIDFKARQVRCPAGRTNINRNPVQQHGKDAIVITFSVLTCRPCPFREQCTASKQGRRMLTLRPQEPHEALVRTRAEQKTDTWKGQVRSARGHRGHHQPGPGRYRDAPGPLPRPAKGPSPARLLRDRDQRHPTRRPLDRSPPPPDPHQQPRTPQLPTYRLNIRNWAAESKTCPKRTGGGLVFQAPKGKNKRILTIPPPLIPLLRAQRTAQKRERLAAADVWEDSDLVFAQQNGRPIDSRRDWDEWQDILKASGVAAKRVHDGRHTAGTLLTENGAGLRVVMEVLGHSQPRVAARYAHVSSPAAEDAAAKMGDALWE
jgi:hypothetical protein